MKRIVIAILLLLAASNVFSQQQKYAHISGKLDSLKDGEPIIVLIHQFSAAIRYPGFVTGDTIKSKGDTFSFDIPCGDEPTYIDIKFPPDVVATFFDSFIVMPGDKIHLSYKNDKFVISGEESSGFNLQYQLTEIRDSINLIIKYPYTPELLETNFSAIDERQKKSLELLTRSEPAISPELYKLLKANVNYMAGSEKAGELYSASYLYVHSTHNPYLNPYLAYLKKINGHTGDVVTDSLTACHSAYFGSYTLYQYLDNSILFQKRIPSIHQAYVMDSTLFKGRLREQLITQLFYSKRKNPEDFSRDMRSFLTYVKEPAFKQVVEGLLSSGGVGSQAYNFKAKDPDGRDVQLSDFIGRVVVLDFWFTGCGACRLMAPKTRRLEEEFKHDPVTFITINIDKDKIEWLHSLKQQLYTSPLSVNLNTNGLTDKAAVIQKYEVGAYPTLVIIDKYGKIGQSPGFPNIDNGRRLENLITQYLSN